MTALMRAAQDGKLERIATLIAAGADVNLRDKDGATAVVFATVGGHRDCVTALATAHADVNANTAQGLTALMIAANDGRADLVKALIAAGADVNAADKELVGALTPLMQASAPSGRVVARDGVPVQYTDAGNVDCIKVLVASGARLTARDKNGNTAIWLAACNGHPECVKALITAGADVNAKANDGSTALLIAQDPDSALALIAAGANVNARDNDGARAIEVIHRSFNKREPARWDAVYSAMKRAGAR